MISGLVKLLQGLVNTIYAVLFARPAHDRPEGRTAFAVTPEPAPKPKQVSQQDVSRQEMAQPRKDDKDNEPWHGRKPYQEAFTFLGRNLAYGLAGGFALGCAILFFDFNNIGTMIWQSPDAWLWIFLLFFGLFITFGGLAMATAVFSLGEERD